MTDDAKNLLTVIKYTELIHQKKIKRTGDVKKFGKS